MSKRPTNLRLDTVPRFQELEEHLECDQQARALYIYMRFIFNFVIIELMSTEFGLISCWVAMSICLLNDALCWMSCPWRCAASDTRSSRRRRFSWRWDREAAWEVISGRHVHCYIRRRMVFTGNYLIKARVLSVVRTCIGSPLFMIPKMGKVVFRCGASVII